MKRIKKTVVVIYISFIRRCETKRTITKHSKKTRILCRIKTQRVNEKKAATANTKETAHLMRVCEPVLSILFSIDGKETT